MPDTGLAGGFDLTGIGRQLPANPDPGQAEDHHGCNRSGNRYQDVVRDTARMVDTEQAREYVIAELAGAEQRQRDAGGKRHETLHGAKR